MSTQEIAAQIYANREEFIGGTLIDKTPPGASRPDLIGVDRAEIMDIKLRHGFLEIEGDTFSSGVLVDSGEIEEVDGGFRCIIKPLGREFTILRK